MDVQRRTYINGSAIDDENLIVLYDLVIDRDGAIHEPLGFII